MHSLGIYSFCRSSTDCLAVLVVLSGALRYPVISHQMSIPVEQVGGERQRIPAVLVKIEKSCGFIKYTSKSAPVKVSLSELQLAPSAFEPCKDDVFGHTEVGNSDATATVNSEATHHFQPREFADIWLSTEATAREITATPENTDTATHVTFHGAWWPGRVLTVQGGFAHVEVAAPLAENGLDDVSAHIVPHLVRMSSTLLPFRSTLVKLEEIRVPWTGRPNDHRPAILPGDHLTQVVTKENFPEPLPLTAPGVLHRHTICIPAYLARLATSADSHSALIKFCDAPCLIQCDSEPFLSSVLAKRILSDSDSAAISGRQTPCAELEVNIPAMTVSADSQTTASPSWPSAGAIAQSTLLNTPNVAGTLSPAAVTDPALLLEGLPGANGPLVLLHIWSGSPEAIRRAALLELAHVRILVFRYHVMRKLSNGEPGELDLADSTDAPTENGDAPVMHCKPISIPVQASSDDSTSGDRAGGMMIGYSAQFRIQPQLVGLAIGFRGATIQEARALPGVRAVDLLHDGIVHVEAETVEACQSVRNLLDFTEAEIPVSPRLASRLIGSKGMNIRKLAASAGVRRALLLDPLARKRRQEQQQLNQRQTSITLSDREHPETNDTGKSSQSANDDKAVDSEHDTDSSDVGNDGSSVAKNEKLPPPAFYLLGTRSAVAKMRLLLEFQADNWNELDELEETRRSLFSQLRQSTQSSGSGMETLPRGPPSGFRGRGRLMSAQGSSVEGGLEHESSNQRPPYNPRGRGGAGQNGGRANNFNRQPSGTSNGAADSADNAHDENGSGQAEQSSGQNHPQANGWRPGSSRGRGRFRPRNQPIPAS
ncbi:Fragile X mental retardation syndrome 1 [Paragonimus heterotremus]|uniref:Fragile X mental retardation syndrome 1 n=1 Tax=Paragonimus heterotremus TaxID=100268 RepID=A0A8J4TEW8_9TREM|nr:Fragile X mental retardation syndrome 1 [Paragonimus heterotremus]